LIVLDASAVVAWLLRQPNEARIAARMFGRGQTLHAPHLLDVEVCQALRKCVLSGLMTDTEGTEALRDFASLPVRRYEHEPLLERIWDLRANLTAYDAVYVTLAEALSAPLVTCDVRLRGASGHTAKVEVL